MLEENDKNLRELAQDFLIQNSFPAKQMEMLGQLDELPKDEAVRVLGYVLDQERNPQILYHIVKQLSKYNAEASFDRLVDLLLLRGAYQNSLIPPGGYLKVRCLITSILGNTKNNNAVVPLLYILNNKDEDYKLRLSSAEALGRIGDTYAVEPLIDIMANEEEKSLYLRESAVKALGMLSDIRAIDPLIKILESKTGIIDKFTFLKERIIETLAKIGARDDKAIKALSSALLDESPYIRLSALEALSDLNDDRAIEIIEPLIKDEEEDVARGAVDALYNIAGRDYVEEILQRPDLPGWCRDEIEVILAEEDNDEE